MWGNERLSFYKGRVYFMEKFLYAAIVVLIFIVAALLIRLLYIKKFHYIPNIGEIHEKKVQVDPNDFIYENHRSQTPIGKVEDYLNISLGNPTLNIAVPYEAISKNGRFLIYVFGNQPYWVEPSNFKKKYSINVSRKKQIEKKTSSTLQQQNPQ